MLLPFTEAEVEQNAPPIAGVGTPAYFAYWAAFRCGVEGQSRPADEPDEHVTAYTRAGFRVGRLFRRMEIQ